MESTHHAYENEYYPDYETDEPSPSLSIQLLSDLALPFEFGHKVYATKPFFASVLAALEDPIEGGCRPLEVRSLLTRIVEDADSLLPTKGSVQKSFFAQCPDGSSFEFVVCIVMPMAIMVLATPEEAAMVAEFASVEG